MAPTILKFFFSLWKQLGKQKCPLDSIRQQQQVYKNFLEPLSLDLRLIKNRIRRGQHFSLNLLISLKHSMQERFGHSVLTLSVMFEINHLAAAVGLLDLRKHLMIGTVSQQVRVIFCHLLSVRESHACYQIRFEISFLCF